MGLSAQRTPLSSLSREELDDVLRNQSSERNIRGLARYSLAHRTRMGVSLITPDELILVVGTVEAVSEKGFLLREESGDWQIDHAQVIKVYAVPDWVR